MKYSEMNMTIHPLQWSLQDSAEAGKMTGLNWAHQISDQISISALRGI